MTDAEKYVRSRLFELQDIGYGDFHAKLIPNISRELIIGVRTPDLRKFAAQFSESALAEDFLKILPHKYYEENNLHGFLIEKIKDYDRVITELDRFLPFVDNWATCDMMSPKIFARNTDKLCGKCEMWIAADDCYTVRFGIGMLMKFYLDDRFDPVFLKTVAAIKSDEYYVNMMIAWYFATALAKQYDSVLPYFQTQRLCKWVHNKAIQKAVESRRISPNQKQYLKSLKIK